MDRTPSPSKSMHRNQYSMLEQTRDECLRWIQIQTRIVTLWVNVYLLRKLETIRIHNRTFSRLSYFDYCKTKDKKFIELNEIKWFTWIRLRKIFDRSFYLKLLNKKKNRELENQIISILPPLLCFARSSRLINRSWSESNSQNLQ